MKVAFVVPTSDRLEHFTHCRNLIDSFEKIKSDSTDLFIVFTNHKEESLFGNLESAKSLVLPHLEDAIVRNWPTIKKYYGILRIYQSYDYIVCIDDESLFKREVDPSDIHSLWESRVWWGCSVPKFSNIIRGASKRFPHQDQSNLERITSRWETYIWWSNVPIYRCDTIPHFFNYIGLSEAGLKHFIKSVEWEEFDHIVYMYYCFLYQGFNMKTIGSVYPEDAQNELEVTTDQHIVETTGALWSCDINLIQRNECMFMQYHIDRFSK